MFNKNKIILRFKRFSNSLPKIRDVLLKTYNALSSISRFVFQILLRVIKVISVLFDQGLGTIPSLIQANRILKTKIQNLYVEGVSDSDIRLKLPVDHLKDYAKLEIERLDRIEEKAKSTVLGVGIAISLATPSVLLPTNTAAFQNHPFYFKLILTIAIGLAVAFLLMSGYLALSAYKVGEISSPRLEYHPSLISENEIREGLILLIDLNVLRIIQKANMLSASMDCLKNGLVLFFLILVISLSSGL